MKVRLHPASATPLNVNGTTMRPGQIRVVRSVGGQPEKPSASACS